MVEFSIIADAYRKAIAADVNLDTNEFLNKYEVEDASKETMLSALNLMISNKKRASSNTSAQTTPQGLTAAIPEETIDARGNTIAPITPQGLTVAIPEETRDANGNIIENSALKPLISEPVSASNITNEMHQVSYINMLKDKDNWSALTSNGAKFKIYEIIQQDEDISIIGLVTTTNATIPIKWNIFGIDPSGEHNIKFDYALVAGDPVIVYDTDGAMYARVFSKQVDDKYITFDAISEDTTNEWDFVMPWKIYNTLINNNT